MEQYYSLDILQTTLYASFQLAFFVQSFFVIFANAFCLFFLLSRRNLRDRCASWFIVGLLFSHVVMGSAFIVYYILTKIEGRASKLLNEYQVKVREVAFISSFIFLIIISLDRYFDIKRPFYYVSLTWRYPLSLLSGALFCISGYFAFVVYTNQMDTTSTCIVAVSTMSVFSATNYTVYHEVKKQTQKIVSTVVTTDDQERMESLKRIKERHLVSLKLCSSITLTFVVCWLPYFLCKVLLACEILHRRRQLSVILQQTSLLVGELDPIIIAILYITLQKREILKNLRCSRTTISTNDNREDSSDSDDDYHASWI